jgi:hypothetical protein
VPFFNPETGLTETRDCTRSFGLRKANDGPCRVFSFHYDAGNLGVADNAGDFLTLDSVLSNEQKGLFGCGPLFGTRCDSGDAVASFDHSTGVEEDVPLIPAGGGIDPLNADAGAFFHAWAGASEKGLTPELRTAFDTAEQERVDTLIPLCRDNAVPPGQPRFCRTFRPLEDLSGTKPVPERFLEPLEATSLTTAASVLQPQTIRLSDGATAGTHPPGCSVFDEAARKIRILPGCRGIQSIDVTTDAAGIPTLFTVSFDEGFLPSVDGCPVGSSGGDQTLDIGGVPVDARASDGTPVSGQLAVELASCADDSGDLAQNSNSRVHDFTLNIGTRLRTGAPVSGAQALFHPLAGCLPDEDAASLDPWRNVCPSGLVAGQEPRDFAAELAGTDPSGRGPENVFLFRSEGAALSFNVQMFLAALSCNGDPEADIMVDPECFDPEDSFSPARCSYAAPQFCGTIKGILGVAGVQRNVVRAGGTNGLGRRTFIWQSGGELALRYNRRNVLGFSMDFAEDVTKTNWGMEFTWVGDTTVLDANSPTSVSDVQTYNLTVSVDRPTFINFLNPNRTFFFNTQWFFQYTSNYRDSMPQNGPFNVLFTFAILAGYFQDRLLPQFISIYDFNSQSGGILPSVAYRFTENFSATIGMLFFFGRTQFNQMPIRGFAPNGNRAGPDAYRDGVDNFIGLIRSRDEIFLRLRWTF